MSNKNICKLLEEIYNLLIKKEEDKKKKKIIGMNAPKKQWTEIPIKKKLMTI